MHKYSGTKEIYTGGPTDVYKLEFTGWVASHFTEHQLYNNVPVSYTIENLGVESFVRKLREEYTDIYIKGSLESNSSIFKIGVPLLEFTPKVRNEYMEVAVNYYYAEESQLKAAQEKFYSTFKEHILEGNFVTISWVFGQKARRVNIKELISDEFVDEAYPTIPNLEQWARDYLYSHESVLILLGYPGTGKTRLIRYLLREGEGDAMYVANQKTLKNEELFVDFLENDYRFLVLEDVDQSLLPRKDGNLSMTNLLTTADGLIQNLNRKVIITTNLPNIRDIDDALIRSGRCWDVHRLRKHTKQEAENFLTLFGEVPTLEKDKYTLAELYKMI